jgi:hypothetical protein
MFFKFHNDQCNRCYTLCTCKSLNTYAQAPEFLRYVYISYIVK